MIRKLELPVFIADVLYRIYLAILLARAEWGIRWTCVLGGWFSK